MSQWTERFEKHRYHDLLAGLRTLIEDTEALPELSIEERESLDRFKQIAIAIDTIILGVDPHLVSLTALDALASSLEASTNEIRAFSSNRALAHINNANRHAETILTQLATLNPLRRLDDVEGLREAVTSFRRSVGQLLRKIETESSQTAASLVELTKRLASFGKEIDSLKVRSDNVVVQLQDQYAKAEALRATQFSEMMERERVKWAEAEKVRDSEFKEMKQGVETSGADIVKELQSQLKEFSIKSLEELNSYDRDVELLLKRYFDALDGHKERAERLVHVIGNTGMVGGYQSAANDSRKKRRYWNGVAVFAMVGLISFAFYAFTGTFKAAEFSWPMFAGRVFVAAAFGILAAYAARLGDRHELAERYNRRMELELASIDPYLVSLPDETQHTVKRELAERLFGHHSESESVAAVSTSGTASDLIPVLRQLIDLIAKQKGS